MTERRAWDRLPGETSKAHAAFRVYRDAGPLRTLASVDGSANVRTAERWSQQHRWGERAVAWDDECHALDDQRRLDSLRTMHDTHQRAARLAMSKAVAALQSIDPDELPAYVAVRLLELGSRLERETLVVSVAELQGISNVEPVVDDPWEQIARALTEPD